MTQQAATGRRRAEAPAAQAHGLRPRDAARRGRRAAARPGPVRQLAEIAGVGQKAGVALAATGLVLTVTLPTAGTEAAMSPAVADTAQQPEVTASGEAVVAFSRTSVGSQVDPDGRLKQLLSVQSAGGVSPAQAKHTLGAPLDSMVASSPFGYRVSPLSGWAGEFHRGQDFAAQCGTAVKAAASGTVTFAGWHPYGGGNRVVIDHGNGLETTYNHLSSASVSVGQKVERGALIALSGTSGASTGCHLHFEVMVNGEVVDPNGWL
ncbi:M23 family metallopeptidase [Sinomonas mesophila]|uniref:M23 family metallopeptidase n=1 Tax=Sinomonas mesophila TaxID=1531955 RepID=UPI00098657BC|nr:M23 family metallopeptidase [Sinomonas mesophila]